MPLSEIFADINRNRFLDVIEKLDKGFNPSTKAQFFPQRTILQHAVLRGRRKMVKLFLRKYNIIDDAVDYEGKTALMYACLSGDFYLVKLLTSEININKEDNLGRTPFSVCYDTFPEIAKWLFNKGAKITCSNIEKEKLLKKLESKQKEITEIKEKHEQLLTLERSYIIRLTDNITKLEEDVQTFRRKNLELYKRIIVKERDIEILRENYESRVDMCYRNHNLELEKLKKIKKPNSSVVSVIIKDFVSKEERCPITTELLTMENCALTTCYHPFDKDSIASWLVNKNTCPVCREECEILI